MGYDIETRKAQFEDLKEIRRLLEYVPAVTIPDYESKGAKAFYKKIGTFKIDDNKKFSHLGINCTGKQIN
jgi:hypothetical protein